MNSNNTIVEKAYEIVLDKLDEGFLSDSIVCHAESLNKARKELLKKVEYDNWRLRYTGEELTYLNIPVRRKKSSDKVMFEGEVVLRYKIEGLKEERQRLQKLDELKNNPNVKYCYIKKGSYYRPNSCGYTSLRYEAGVYNKEEAIQHAKSVREISLEVVNIEEHNKMIKQKIEELQTRIL